MRAIGFVVLCGLTFFLARELSRTAAGGAPTGGAGPVELGSQRGLHFRSDPLVPGDFDREKWRLYELIHAPSFSLAEDSDWSPLFAELDRDLRGTIDRLAEIDLLGSNRLVEVPLALASYFSRRGLTEALAGLEPALRNEELYHRTAQQLVTQQVETRAGLEEMMAFLKDSPDHPAVERSAYLTGLAIGRHQSGTEAVALLEELPHESCWGEVAHGLVAQQLQDGAVQPELVAILSRQPEQFVEALSAIAVSLAGQEPSRAMALVAKLPKKDREERMRHVVTEWHEQHPTAAEAWLMSNRHLFVNRQPVLIR